MLKRFDLLQAPARPARRDLNGTRELGIVARLGPDPLARTAKSCADFSVGKPNFICHLFLVFTQDDGKSSDRLTAPQAPSCDAVLEL